MLALASAIVLMAAAPAAAAEGEGERPIGCRRSRQGVPANSPLGEITNASSASALVPPAPRPPSHAVDRVALLAAATSCTNGKKDGLESGIDCECRCGEGACERA